MGQASCCVEDRTNSQQSELQRMEKEKAVSFDVQKEQAELDIISKQSSDKTHLQSQQDNNTNQNQIKSTFHLKIPKEDQQTQSSQQLNSQNQDQSQLQMKSPKGIQIHIKADPQLLNVSDSDEEYRKSTGVNFNNAVGVNLIDQLEFESNERQSSSRAQMRRQQYNYMQTDLNEVFQGDFKQKMEEEQEAENLRVSPQKTKQNSTINKVSIESTGERESNSIINQDISSDKNDSKKKLSSNPFDIYE